ncbi:hypothetical protein ASE63_24925 [Bosea sp. Root381]|uniref:extracellular catalytic domain type 1 short-chain-length polyhydroxyalkanoate depolymerase n=1 Tax=Bosea sp. Root381 TaxID=1736524 RepID=UPI0006F1C9C4|nr:PHB depolymerase family esterase [Bosea sp. Root381]KRE05013.1 hypothetical protein ASE63_24925 [Bosea sp. Root381]
MGDVLNALKSSRSGFSSSATSATTALNDGDSRFTSRSLSSAAGGLNYKLYVPQDRDRELALLLMLHGCTQDPDDFARGTRMNRLADEFGLVVAYPHQPRSANANGCWNWFDRRHQSAGSGEPAKLAALARALTTEFAIAPERVFAAGLSAGAAMADVLAEAYPEIFSGVGLHSGLERGSAHDVMSAFAAMKGDVSGRHDKAGGACSRKLIMHGTADPTVDASNGDRLFTSMRARFPDVRLVASEVKSNGRSAVRQALVDPSGRVLAEYIAIEGAGHAWSGGATAGTFTDPQGPNASREMIEFFLRR